jgi:hypothetical protein
VRLLEQLEAAQRDRKLLRDKLDEVSVWWGASWDCSATPGHGGYPEGIDELLAATADRPGVTAPAESREP